MSAAAAQRAGSWLFLVGSLAFTADAAIAVADGATVREALYLAGCLLFVTGCGYFVRASSGPASRD